MLVSLERRMVDKVRKMGNIIWVLVNWMKFRFEYMGKVIVSERIGLRFM